jgi:hypothetical protein
MRPEKQQHAQGVISVMGQLHDSQPMPETGKMQI